LSTYRDYIDAQERTYMTQDEKLEKKNSEILMLYSTVGGNINKRGIPENMMSKAETVNKEPEKCKKKCN